ncbi:hypothetical protein VNI00_004596 [Paramarasmius palmivorus]|uniref:Uncharacterized protein n=1 Tax=Paramarasmius palmivorus TaxID=297713 RepID=A0AAW0DLQ8_9AGAR
MHLQTSQFLTEERNIARLEALSQVLDLPSRVDTLYLSIPHAFMDKVASRAIRPAPSLQRLVLMSNGYDFPRDFLGGVAPLLTTLYLRHCGLAVDSPLLYNIISLNIEGHAQGSNFAARLCEVLRLMPSLEYLDIHDIYPNPPADTAIASLPKLRKLNLRCIFPSCTAMLEHISFPATTFVQIDIANPSLLDIDEEDLSSMWTSVARILAPDFHPEGQRIVRTVAAEGDGEFRATSFTLMMWELKVSNTSTPLPSPNLLVMLDWTDREENALANPVFFEEVFQAAFSALPLPHLETLHLGCFPKEAMSKFGLFKRALRPHLWSSTLQTLILHVEHCVEYLPAMLVHQPDNGPLPLPALETLLFTSVKFDRRIVERLVRSLRTRSDQGVKLRKVIMDGGCANEAGRAMYSFREAVEHVEWSFSSQELDYSADEYSDTDSDSGSSA